MTFYTKRRRRPEVIIVSLIDIFAILLIFVIVTTTFKTEQPPAVTIKLPESKTAVSAENAEPPVVLTIAPDERIFLGEKELSLDELKSSIQAMVGEKTKKTLALNADTAAPFGVVIRVLDVLREAGVKGNLSAFMETNKK